ncbi:uncharacterized protein BO72DRAFT_474623 [Aspergillus fijiensis CBS 313.89]|uniref:Uncharacterized protein n=1 Tax=Aspergillus fijiensis CBS 313.89 TaxID=1448319 RepID=A0A8G1RYZ5_9EURO|nr:uncharacterized protein BO72DRAFT_474623 [Aspergillus fijiensis CBS 313.89]RAK81449.1 hypothetical protein BO72DRAFT_474623 [Aspergillus fijiensis CBS 313.89]
MSATILSRIVSLDTLIPRVVDIGREERDVETLTPWVFKHTNIAQEDCLDSWPNEDLTSSMLFDEFFSYHSTIRSRSSLQDERRIESALTPSAGITLPLKNWEVKAAHDHLEFTRSQGMILRMLMKTVYASLDGVRKQDPEVLFSIHASKLRYVIGGTQYSARSEGEMTVGPRGRGIPIISYTGWWIGQAWDEFLQETLSVMLGQLAQNLGVGKDDSLSEDQEVFLVGFHGYGIQIARGAFTRDAVTRVHSRGCSGDETFEVHFTRGYNLCQKREWDDAMRALTRLFRYLLGGGAKVGGRFGTHSG